MKSSKRFAYLLAMAVGCQGTLLMAQSTALPPLTPTSTSPWTPRATTAPSTSGVQQAAPITNEQIEALVAPIALYPDSLVSQILMASTYPLEVVEAQRWAKANKFVGTALATELEKQKWDASVKSLVTFPTVLDMMSEKLDSTIKLGDAFIADQKSVLDAVQRLRAKAKAQGNLETTKEQKVIIEQAPSTTTQIIKIEPTNPEYIYVPTYNPTVVYGSWPYPSYPPYYWYPPGYTWGAAAIGWGVGFACGAAWGYAWGNCNWGGGDVDVDVNRNTNFNRNIDRSKAQNRINDLDRQRGERGGAGGRDGVGGNRPQAKNSFNHDPAHRQGVGYRDNKTAQQFGGASDKAQQARQQFRGQAQAGQRDLAAGGAGQFKGANAPRPTVGNTGGNFAGGGAANRPTAGTGAVNRPAGGAGAAQRPAAAQRPSTGINTGGRTAPQVNAASNRGTASRASSAARPAPRSAPRPAARPAGGGGGARGGGGGRR